jgi:1-deoxy-D-xylulose-5-phosphate reductoisomerase
VSEPRKILLLGSTGSIGRSTLDVVRHLRDRFRIVALSANSNARRLAEQALEFRPRAVAIGDASHAGDLRARLHGTGTEIWTGPGSIQRLVADVEADLVVSAVVGGCGLAAAVEAAERGRVLALANKESLVMAGHILMDLAARHGATILPVDSEHSAIHQAMMAGRRSEVERVILTASGGPFFRRSPGQLAAVTPEEALAHPNWDMGRKITVDSATLLNKALEVIEARWLFGLDSDQIGVLIHPQSIVHSLVEFQDGSVLAQLGVPDMKLPIQYALTWPERCPGPAPRLDMAGVRNLEFYEPDMDRFPALRLGFEAARVGGTVGTILSGANEIAVQAFLDGRIPFTEIIPLVQRVLDAHDFKPDPSLEEIFEADRWARTEARRCIC